MARLTTHRRGQGLTPHRTWLLRARRSGPGSWLQLKGEDREMKGAANMIPVHWQKPAGTTPAPWLLLRASMMDTGHLTPSAQTPIPPTLPASSSGGWRASGAATSTACVSPACGVC